MQTPKEVHLDHNNIFYGMIGLLSLENFIINGRNAKIFLEAPASLNISIGINYFGNFFTE